MTTALPLARTNAEARLFLRLRPCATCGVARCEFRSSVITADGPASRYVGECAACGTRREYVFRLPERILPPPAEQVRFGADEPSQLLDPGEWLRYSRICADQAGPDDPERTATARHALATALAAVTEVLKFIPVDAPSVPAAAFVTTEGRALFAAEPGSFDRDRLAAVRAHYAERLARW
ncbi:hypothetical protein [Nocardia rhizosphaerihabitans]|uniref:Uncharacterized protein n=1 Tax=Nocardia rhizosphaerihabitans TaxID=1691570 RepID=A0ABQ2KK90_9NOCA|nr:hypothetical protein [Nocardia rhizosphaerihabitans]GGN85875.1 hypothetical protein GCM10011610_40560 [Nocardia rhizosphaerihabitans]